MFYKIESKEGFISIEKAVIARIITEEVARMKGKVQISSAKGKVPGLVSKIGGLDEASHLEILMGRKGLDIRVYVVIRFGTSIGMVTNLLIGRIQEKIREFTTIEANSIAIVVTGMISKHLSRRNIEVKR